MAEMYFLTGRAYRKDQVNNYEAKYGIYTTMEKAEEAISNLLLMTDKNGPVRCDHMLTDNSYEYTVRLKNEDADVKYTIRRFPVDEMYVKETG